MQYKIRIVLCFSLSMILLGVGIPALKQMKTRYYTDIKPPVSTGEITNAMPYFFKGVPVEISVDPGVLILNYENNGEVIIRIFDSESELLDNLIIKTIDAGRSRVNRRLNLAMITNREVTNLKTGESGEFTTKDGYVGYYWYKDNFFYSIAAVSKENLRLLIDYFPYIREYNNDEKSLVAKFYEKSPVLYLIISVISILSGLFFLIYGSCLIVKRQKRPV